MSGNSSMIERVARAIFNCPAGAEEFHPKWDSMTDEWKSESLMKARAAIEAMLPFIAQGLVKFSGDTIPPDGKDYLIFPRPNPLPEDQ